MDRDQIDRLLRELATELAAVEVRGELLLVGGAAMALAYSSRRATEDLDAMFEPKLVIYEAAARISERHNLPPDWLNDAVKAFVPGDDPNALVYLDEPGLVVRVASPRFVLAMKLLASRVERDEDDIRVLLRLSSIATTEEAMQLVADFYPAAVVPATVQFLVEEILRG